MWKVYLKDRPAKFERQQAMRRREQEMRYLHSIFVKVLCNFLRHEDPNLYYRTEVIRQHCFFYLRVEGNIQGWDGVAFLNRHLLTIVGERYWYKSHTHMTGMVLRNLTEENKAEVFEAIRMLWDVVFYGLPLVENPNIRIS